MLAVDTHWSSAKGGVSTFNRQLCIALAEAKAEVYCLVYEASDQDRDDAETHRVHLRVADRRGRRPQSEALMMRPDLPGGLRPDLIIGHGRVTGRIALAHRTNFYPDAAYFHVIHTSPDDIEWQKTDREDRPGIPGEQKWEDELELVTEADRVFAVGPYLYDLAKEYVGGLEETLDPIQLDPGFDSRRQPAKRPSGRTKSIVIAGRLEDEDIKGLDVAAHAIGVAVRLLGTAGKDIRFVLRGVPGKSAHELHRRVAVWSDTPSLRVAFRGFSADPEKLWSDLARATLVLMPSRAEGFGLAGLEAITAGRPVLVSDRSGLAWLLDSVLDGRTSGIVVPVEQHPTRTPNAGVEKSPRWSVIPGPHLVGQPHSSTVCELRGHGRWPPRKFSMRGG